MQKRLLQAGFICLLGQAVSGLADDYRQLPGTVIYSADTYRISNAGAMGMNLREDRENPVSGSKTPVTLSTPSLNKPGSIWNIKDSGNGLYQITSYPDGRFLNVSTTENEKIALNLTDSKIPADEIWKLDPLKLGFRIRRPETNLCLHAPAYFEDTPITLKPENDSDRQSWLLQRLVNVHAASIVRTPENNLAIYTAPNGQSPPTPPKGLIYSSADNGTTWEQIARVPYIYAPSFFTFRDRLYLIGCQTNKLVLLESKNDGVIWSDAHVLHEFDASLESAGSAPVLIDDDYIYYGFMDTGNAGRWPAQYRLVIASCPTDQSPLFEKSWTFSEPKAFPANPAVSDTREGWLEPNCLKGPDGRIWVLARVDHEPRGDVAAMLKLSDDRKQLEFENRYPAPGNATGFFDAPWAGCGKFHIVYDHVSQRYLVMSNPYLGESSPQERHPYVRNILALYETKDLKNYSLVKTLIDPDLHEDWEDSSIYTGFQQPAFIIDGNTLHYAMRTAYASLINYHDSNKQTYHTLEKFRNYLDPDGEIAHYSFDAPDAPGTDSSKMKNSPADVVGARYSPAGKRNGCLLFDGENDSLGLLHRLSPKLHRSKTVSLAAWVKTTQPGPVFCSAIDGHLTGLGLDVLNGKLRVSGRSHADEAIQILEVPFPTDRQWHHITAFWDFENNRIQVWLDACEMPNCGESISFSNPSYTRAAPAKQDRIGQSLNGDAFFGGALDEVHIYNRPLSTDEIKALHARD